jgi:hypothetical protein
MAMTSQPFDPEPCDSPPRLAGPPPSLVNRLRAWIISSIFMAVGAVALVLSVMAGAVVLVVAIGLGVVLALVGGVMFLLMRHKWRRQIEEFRRRADPNLQGGRQNVRVIVHPPGDEA